jgi:hypothetical protein
MEIQTNTGTTKGTIIILLISVFRVLGKGAGGQTDPKLDLSNKKSSVSSAQFSRNFEKAVNTGKSLNWFSKLG